MKPALIRAALCTAMLMTTLSACTFTSEKTARAECAQKTESKNAHSKAYDSNSYELCMNTAKQKQKDKQTKETTVGVVSFLLDLFDGS